MTNRRPLICRGCQSKIVTRTQIGLGDRQDHSFVCAKCGVVISFTIDLDQERVAFSYRQPRNADWTEDEGGAIGAVSLSQEIPVPNEGDNGLVSSTEFRPSPYIATSWNVESREEHRASEEQRSGFVRRFDEIERCITHYERGDWPLFDATMESGRDDPNAVSRLQSLYGTIQGGLQLFTRTPRAKYDRILQRLRFAASREPQLMEELGEVFVASGRMKKLWKEIAENRRLFLSEYNGLQPLVQMRHWREELRTPAAFLVSVKRFESLRQLYLNMYETLCRLLIIGMMVETVINSGSAKIRLGKRWVSLEQFEGLANGVKCDHFPAMVVCALFEHALDRGLRNGIGHNAAHYEGESDEVHLFDFRRGATVAGRIGYTVFCDRVLQLFEAMELAAVYHHWLHISVEGRLE